MKQENIFYIVVYKVGNRHNFLGTVDGKYEKVMYLISATKFFSYYDALESSKYFVNGEVKEMKVTYNVDMEGC